MSLLLALQSAGGGVTVAADTGSLTLTGLPPSLTASVVAQAGALTVTGLPPSLRVSLAADVGTLAITGQAPTLALATLLSAGVGSLTLTGQAPNLALAANLPVGVGALTLAGQTPQLAASTPAGVGSLVLTGQAPTANVSVPVTVAPDAGALALDGLTPATVLSAALVTDVGALALAGLAPALDTAVAPAAGVLTIEGFAPDILGAEPPVVVPPHAHGGYGAAPYDVPLERRPITVRPGVGALVLRGLRPTVEITTHSTTSEEPDQYASAPFTVTPWTPEADEAFSLSDDEALLVALLVS
jgi:hypothetical protein